jgi:serine protease Do
MKRILPLAALLLAAPVLSAADRAALWAERVNSVVAIEFFTETELDRRPSFSYGTVIDDQGTVVLPAPAVNPRATPAQLKDFRVYRPGQPVTAYYAGEYLGQDPVTDWHFVRIEEKGREGLVPITAFAGDTPGEPAMAEEVWGIGLRKKDEDFMPYYLTGQVAITQAIPRKTALATMDVTGPGLPVFSREGQFLGLGAVGFGQTFVMFSERARGGQGIVLVDSEECAAFLVASEVLPHLNRIPANVYGRPWPWLGAHGLEPVDPEVARFLNIENQAGLVVSEVLEGSPAEKAGMQERDILLALDGSPLPRLKPDAVVAGYLDNEITRRAPGDSVALTVLRGTERVELTATLEEAPPTPREVERRYFEQLGLTVRDFSFSDGVARRVKKAEHGGVVAHFVKPNTPIATAGLRTDDWIKEIDGSEVKTFADAVEKLAAIEADKERAETVILASRGGETAVLRVKLK